MDGVILELLPLALGAALAPLWPIIVLLLLQREGGLGNAAAFVSGALAVRLAQGVLFGLVLGVSRSGGERGPVISTLLLVVGLLLLVTAFRKWRKGEDPDAPPPQWLETVGGLSGLRAFGAGAFLMAIGIKQWVFTLSAIAVITYTGPGGAANVGLYLGFVLATQLLILPPLIAFLVAPKQVAPQLTVMRQWLERNNTPIAIAVSLIFGIWFSFKGASGLFG
jgi:hypothetical protein